MLAHPQLSQQINRQTSQFQLDLSVIASVQVFLLFVPSLKLMAPFSLPLEITNVPSILVAPLYCGQRSDFGVWVRRLQQAKG